MEGVLGGMNKVILDGVSGEGAGQGVVPYLPLNNLTPGANTTNGGSN
jgi:membrane protease subunit HflK